MYHSQYSEWAYFFGPYFKVLEKMDSSSVLITSNPACTFAVSWVATPFLEQCVLFCIKQWTKLSSSSQYSSVFSSPFHWTGFKNIVSNPFLTHSFTAQKLNGTFPVVGRCLFSLQLVDALCKAQTTASYFSRAELKLCFPGKIYYQAVTNTAVWFLFWVRW